MEQDNHQTSRCLSEGDTLVDIRNRGPFPLGFQIRLPQRHDQRPRNGFTPSFSYESASWPPRGSSPGPEISPEHAEIQICRGALYFEGLIIQLTNSVEDHHSFYSTVYVADGTGSFEAAASSSRAPEHMSLQLFKAGGKWSPWDALEQPSMTESFGLLPGTCTMNYWVGKDVEHRPLVHLVNLFTNAYPIDKKLVLQRLLYLQNGPDQDPERAANFLYNRLVHDSEKYLGRPPPPLEEQIDIIIIALNHPMWTDFSDAKHYCLAKYHDSPILCVKIAFFEQLLLSIELYHRVQQVLERNPHNDNHRRNILSKVPCNIAWDLALAQVWLSKMRFEPLSHQSLPEPDVFRVRALDKKNQVKRLLNFGRKMDFPCLAEVQNLLEETHEGAIPLESKSSHASSWISGAIFPGKSSSWLIMRCLLDADPVGINMCDFDQMPSNFGFQYRASTYWYWESIVGKVLGACNDANQDYGWIGPCIPSDDLSAAQTVLITSKDPSQHLTKRQVATMGDSSVPLGPAARMYPVEDYTMPRPTSTLSTKAVKFHTLSFKPKSTTLPSSDTYQAGLVFIIDGESFPVRLTHNVYFIVCPPCKQGPHPLFYDYVYTSIKAEKLLSVRPPNFIPLDSDSLTNASGERIAATYRTTICADTKPHNTGKIPEPDTVLVVEALGAADNEVLARAWAAHWGVSAIVADDGSTCMACAIRAAYASRLGVVILRGELASRDGEREGRQGGLERLDGGEVD